MGKINKSRQNIDIELLDMERTRISDELHDTVVQNLTALGHKCELCDRLFDIDPVKSRIELSAMSDVISETIRELRDIIYNLRPPSVTDFGLKQGIEDYCDSINKIHSIVFHVKHSGLVVGLPDAVQNNLFRIAQEACNNIIKHSKATEATISLEYKDDGLLLSVSDNGLGIIETERSKSGLGRKHFGLSIMRDRAALINGSFEINTQPNKGTNIIVFVPYKREVLEKND